MNEPVHIEQKNESEYQVHNLPRNQGIWVQVENFDIQIKRTDEGIVLDIYDMDDEERSGSIGYAYAFDSETRSFQED